MEDIVKAGLALVGCFIGGVVITKVIDKRGMANAYTMGYQVGYEKGGNDMYDALSKLNGVSEELKERGLA